jgi:hypothetical protein
MSTSPPRDVQNGSFTGLPGCATAHEMPRGARCDLTTNLPTKRWTMWSTLALCTALWHLAEHREQAAQGAPLLWQARGRRFESAMLHPRNLNSDLALGNFDC